MKPNIIKDIDRERDRQDNIWGDNPHTVGEWLLILENQLNDAKITWIKSTKDECVIEILQLTAVGIACLEQYT